MKYTRLGQSGLHVSRICFGCMSYGDPAWRPWVLPEKEARPFFEKALDHGINFFDTANMYSRGVSEEITGKLLREMANMDEVVLATKVFFPVNDGPNQSGLSRKNIVQACEASLKRLGVEAIDLYQIHRFDPGVPLEETLEALDLLVRQGKVRYIGASSGPAWLFARALYLSDRNGWARFISMQNHYNLIYREEEREMMPLCREEGIGVIPWSPLARGVLTRPAERIKATSRGESDTYSPRLYDAPEDMDVVGAVEEVARQRGVPMAEVALAWLLNQPGVSAPIVGFTKLAHLDTAVKALDMKLTGEETQILEAHYRPHAVKGFTYS